MFAGVTIVCVFVGLVVRPAEEQKRAVEALRAIDDAPYGYKEDRIVEFDRYQRGIKIIYDYEIRTVHDGDSEWIEKVYGPLPGPAWLRDLIGIDYFADVVTVALMGPSRDDDLRRLRHFRKLESLHVSHWRYCQELWPGAFAQAASCNSPSLNILPSMR